jgi:hypothetical protein
MTRKSCSYCWRPAEFSLCHLISTIGTTPREQKCSQALVLCNDCIQRIFSLIEALPFHGYAPPLSGAYTALAKVSANKANSKAEAGS